MVTIKSHVTPEMKRTIQEFAREDGVSVSNYVTRLVKNKMLAAGWTIPTSKRIGYVYLIECAGRFKIGRAMDVKQRISSMQLPMEPKIHVYQPCEKYVEKERQLHDRFAAKRVYGEWFVFTDAELAEATKLIQQQP